MDIPVTSIRSSALDQIISDYADMWAEVILDKNLEDHLKKIRADINFLNKLICMREKKGKDNTQFIRIADQLYALRQVVLKKMHT